MANSQMQFGLVAADLFPLRPRLLPDELLSSWLVRLAGANRMKVHHLMQLLTGRMRGSHWGIDIDRTFTDDFLARLAVKTATPLDRIHEATVPEVALRVAGTHQPNSNTAWVLPLRIAGQKRKGFGMQYCPLCLKVTKRPYFRRSWRIAFYTECERHHVLMEDRCRTCDAPVQFFRSELGKRSERVGVPLNYCMSCGTALWEGEPRRFEWPTWQHIVTLRSILLARDMSWGLLEGRVFESAVHLFAALRAVIKSLASKSASGELYDYVAREIWRGAAYPVLSNRGSKFESRSVEERHRLFGMAVWLLMDWPVRLDRAARELQFPPSKLFGAATDLPSWLRNERAPYGSAIQMQLDFGASAKLESARIRY